MSSEGKKLSYENCKICIFGLQGSGKSVFVEHYLLNQYKNPVIYLMHQEDFSSRGDHVKIISPQDKNGNVDTSMKTLNNYSKEIKEKSLKGEVDAFVIDEADLFIMKDFRAMQKFPFFHDLVINHRHYGVALIFITRRPQELPTAITEQSAHYFIFHIAGKNVRDHLNKLEDNLGEMASKKLSRHSHNFIHLEFGEKNPIKLYGAIKFPNLIKQTV